MTTSLNQGHIIMLAGTKAFWGTFLVFVFHLETKT